MSDTTTTRSGPSARVAHVVVLLAAVWLLGSWGLYLERQVLLDGTLHVFVGVIAGAWLALLASYQLLAGASHLASVLTAWTGVLLVLAPVALRYGGVDRLEAAYVNHIVTGLVVLLAGIWSARRAQPAG